MKTKEFIKKVEELGYVVKEFTTSVTVYKNERIVLEVRLNIKNKINTTLGFNPDDKLFDLAVEYAKTPVSEREEPKKYYLIAKGYHNKNSYFNYFLDWKGWFIGSKADTSACQTKFTQEEIDNHEFSDIMKAFEKVEVEE